jgi:hypothetical protein
MEAKSVRAINEQKASAPMARRRRWLIGPLISLLTVIVFLGGLELVAYAWEQNTAQGPLGWTLVASRRMLTERHGTEQQPYFLLEPDRDYNWEGVPVHINSRGLRTPEFSVPKPPNTFRILNLGDSVVFGWEVRQEDTYGQKLASILNQRDDSRSYEVINAGVPGWDLETERRFLIQEGLDYQPDLILLDLTIVNDIHIDEPSEERERHALFDWLRDNTYSWPFLTTQARFLLSKKRGPEAIPVLNPSTDVDFYFPLDKNDEIWDELWQEIAGMYEAAQEHGIDLRIVAFPTALQINSAAHPHVPQQVFGERAQKTGIDFIDLTPIFQQECERLPEPACEGFENKLFADVWMHPTELGHQLTADYLVDTLEDRS